MTVRLCINCVHSDTVERGLVCRRKPPINHPTTGEQWYPLCGSERHTGFWSRMTLSEPRCGEDGRYYVQKDRNTPTGVRWETPSD